MEFEHAVCGFVGHEDAAVGVCRDDGCWTALDEGVKLLLGLEASFALAFDFAQLPDDDLAVAVGFVDEHADGEEGEEVEDIAGKTGAEGPGELIELFSEERAETSYSHDLPRL